MCDHEQIIKHVAETQDESVLLCWFLSSNISQNRLDYRWSRFNNRFVIRWWTCINITFIAIIAQIIGLQNTPLINETHWKIPWTPVTSPYQRIKPTMFFISILIWWWFGTIFVRLDGTEVICETSRFLSKHTAEIFDQLTTDAVFHLVSQHLSISI